jgi:tetratricopeptide (TPR) repeat protein
LVTKKTYISLLKNPVLTDKNTITQLEKLQEMYPFCGNIQMLLTKGYHDNDNINYENQLKNTAISIPNRESLYNLIYKTLVKELINEEETQEKATEVSPIIETEKEIIAPVNIIEEQEETTENKTSIETIIKNKESTPDKLEELILSHAIGASYILEDKTDKKDVLVKKIEEKQKEASSKHHSFYSWLTPTETISTPKENNKNSIDNLVEKFITSKESSKIKRKDFFSPTNVAKLSIVETDDFITETLADIYFKQNMHDKALNAYEKLILKNPEKKPYFASQIEKIKNLLE